MIPVLYRLSYPANKLKDKSQYIKSLFIQSITKIAPRLENLKTGVGGEDAYVAVFVGCATHDALECAGEVGSVGESEFIGHFFN